MKTAGRLLIVASVLILIFGVLDGILTYSASRGGSTGILLTAASILAWLILYGLGSALMTLQDMSEDALRTADAAERSAEALEYLARRQRSPVPPMRPADQSKSPLKETATPIRRS